MSNAELTRALLQAQMDLINIYLANTNRFLEQTKINGHFMEEPGRSICAADLSEHTFGNEYLAKLEQQAFLRYCRIYCDKMVLDKSQEAQLLKFYEMRCAPRIDLFNDACVKWPKPDKTLDV